jgi:hypothetical protein
LEGALDMLITLQYPDYTASHAIAHEDTLLLDVRIYNDELYARIQSGDTIILNGDTQQYRVVSKYRKNIHLMSIKT